MRDKGRSFLHAVAGQAMKIIADMANTLTIEERSATLPVEELRLRARAMEAFFEDARARRDDTVALLRHEIDALVAMIEEDLEEIKARATRHCWMN
jgi:hypothetical protein